MVSLTGQKTDKCHFPNRFPRPGLQHICMLRGISPAKWTRTKLWGKVVSQMHFVLPAVDLNTFQPHGFQLNFKDIGLRFIMVYFTKFQTHSMRKHVILWTHEPNPQPSQFNENNALLEQKPEASSATTCSATRENGLKKKKTNVHHLCGQVDQIKPRCCSTRQHACEEMLKPTSEGKQKRITVEIPNSTKTKKCQPVPMQPPRSCHFRILMPQRALGWHTNHTIFWHRIPWLCCWGETW